MYVISYCCLCSSQTHVTFTLYYNRIPNVAASGQVNEVLGEAGKVRTTFISLLFYVY